MDMQKLAAPAIEAVRDGRIRFTPERWSRVYLDWLENIRPWCISRQLWWGHRIPVWYCEPHGHMQAATEPPERCPECGSTDLHQDPDVLDTWFSSGLWPFATLGWPQDTPQLRAFYPTDVLVTGRDIIFLWVARMVMLGIEFAGDVPFSDVYITSIIQAPDGRRMSKSLGTGIDPLDEIAAHGADAVRFGLLAMSSSQDVRYSAEKVAQGQGLANKLWNASRLILTNAGGAQSGAGAPAPATLEDRWIVSRLQRAIEQTTARIESYDFHHAALGLYDFVYGELCDWYLELVKPRLYGDAEQAAAASAVLVHVLERTLALAHPVIPFVTEEIWSQVPGAAGLLAAGPFPEADPALVDDDAEAALGDVIAAVQALRGWRDGVGLRPAERVPARLEAEGYGETAAQVARLARFEFDGANGGDPVATVAVPGGTVAVLAAGAMDPGEATRKLEQERARLESEVARSEGKLANEGFVGKAPPDVVQAERDKLERLRGELAGL
jgi:valyl-tRNA synthetase